MTKLFSKYPAAIYYVLAMIGTIALGTPQMIFFPQSLDYTLMLGQWGPAAAAVVVTLVASGNSGLAPLWRKLSLRGMKLNDIFLAVIVPFVCAMLAYLVISLVEYGRLIPPVLTRSFPNYCVCLAATLFSVIGEEIGWRGFMLPTLLKKHSIIVSSFILGLCWGIWHFRFQSFWLALFYLIVVIEYAFMFSWLYQKTGGGLSIGVLLHTSINTCSFILFENLLLVTNPAASLRLNTLLYGVYAAVFALPAALAAISFRRRNSRITK